VDLGPEEAVEVAVWAVAWYDSTGEFELRVVGDRRGDRVAKITGPTGLVLQTVRPAIR